MKGKNWNRKEWASFHARKAQSKLRPGEREALDAIAIHTKTETAAIMGITYQAVFHLERSALHKIRRRLSHYYPTPLAA